MSVEDGEDARDAGEGGLDLPPGGRPSSPHHFTPTCFQTPGSLRSLYMTFIRFKYFLLHQN